MEDQILGINITEEVSRENFQRIYEDNFKQIKRNLNSSKGKDIVAFVGLTGSGKSTLINYLCGKELVVDDDEDIVLENSNDIHAMKIGTNGVSETFLPKFIEYNEILVNRTTLFYDLPGFSDSRGILMNLLNSAIIKNIIKNAKTAILVFVISEDEIIAGRGKLFKEIVSGLKTLIPNETFEDNSALVVTKSLPGKNIEDLVKKLRKKTEEDIVIKCHSTGCLAKMERAHQGKINQTDRETILEAIFNVQRKCLNAVDIQAICDKSSLRVLKKICKEEVHKVFENHLLQICDSTLINHLSTKEEKIKTPAFDKNLISSLTIPELKDKINRLNKSVEECQFECSPLIVLLKTISMEIFDSVLVFLKDKMRPLVKNLVYQCCIEILRQEKITKQQQEEQTSSNWSTRDVLHAAAGIALTIMLKRYFKF